MKCFLLLLVAVTGALAATYQETKEIVDKAGTSFTCTYKIVYSGDSVNKKKSGVNCVPNQNGKTHTSELEVAALGKTVSVTHKIKKGRDSITAIELLEPTAVTSAPNNPEGSLQCRCRLPMASSPVVMGRALNRGGYHGVSSGSSGLSSLIPLILTFLVSALVGNALAGLVGGRSLDLGDSVAERELNQAKILAKLDDRQLFGNLGSGGLFGNVPAPAPSPATGGIFGNLGNGGLFGNLGNGNVPAPAPAPAPATGGLFGNLGSGGLFGNLGGASGGGSNDFVNQLVMQMVQQQMEDFINNGGAQEALTNMVESGQLEQTVQQMVDSGMLEQLVQQLRESGLLEQAAQSALESVSQSISENMPTLPPTLENLGGLNGGFEELFANMGDFNTGDFNLGDMELEMSCDCDPAN